MICQGICIVQFILAGMTPPAINVLLFFLFPGIYDNYSGCLYARRRLISVQAGYTIKTDPIRESFLPILAIFTPFLIGKSDE
jgi:hypothetical protein